MKIVEQTAELIYPFLKDIDPIVETVDWTGLYLIEMAGRTCYNSNERMKWTPDDAGEFAKRLIRSGHDSPIEFMDFTFTLKTSRDVLAELTRHRIASFAVQSQRYVEYKREDGGIEFIQPEFLKSEPSIRYDIWKDGCKGSEEAYLAMLKAKARKEDARKVLNNSVATIVMVKMNARELRHFFKLRTSKHAYPEMRKLANLMLEEVKDVPGIFDDILEGLNYER